MIPGRLYPKNKFNLSEDPETSLIRAFFYKNNGQPNKLFLKKYFNNIDEITEVNFLKNFFDERKKKIDQINSAIYADYFLIDNNFNNKYGPGYYYFSEEDIFTRAKILKKKIKPELSKINIKEDQNNIYLINKSSKNLILETVQFICEINNTSSNENKKILYKIELDLNIEQKIIKNNLFDNIHKCNSVDFSNLKKSKIYSKNISFFLNTILKKDTDFLQYFKISDNILTLANDEIIIEKDIIIPQNYTVKIKSGQKIKIINNSLILSHSPWEVNGETSKVKIVGDKNNFGGGIFIKNKNKISKFQNVKFEYLAGVEERIFHNPYPKDNKFVITSYRGVKKNDYKKNVIYLKSEEYMTSEFLKLTGAITIYMGKTIFDNCEFKKISSEDAINLIKTTSSLNNLSFDENSSDSIDIDFGIAKITNSKFKNIEGDGIDVSGSEVEINKINFYNISDKAISVGEESLANIKNIYGEKSFIGIAVKDGSHTNVSKVHFNNVQFPFASYQKKKFYNFPTIKINNEIMLENYTKKFLKDKDSTIIYKNETIKKYLDKILPFVYKAKDESTS